MVHIPQILGGWAHKTFLPSYLLFIPMPKIPADPALLCGQLILNSNKSLAETLTLAVGCLSCLSAVKIKGSFTIDTKVKENLIF